jgi:hypothetical protein
VFLSGHDNPNLIGRNMTMAMSLRVWLNDGTAHRVKGFGGLQHKGNSPYFRIAFNGHAIEDGVVDPKPQSGKVELPCLSAVQNWEINTEETDAARFVIKMRFATIGDSQVNKIQMTMPTPNKEQRDMASSFRDALIAMNRERRRALGFRGLLP